MRLQHHFPYLIEVVAENAPSPTKVVYCQVANPEWVLDPEGRTTYICNRLTVFHDGKAVVEIDKVFARTIPQLLHIARALAGEYNYKINIRSALFHIGPTLDDEIQVDDGKIELRLHGVRIRAGMSQRGYDLGALKRKIRRMKAEARRVARIARPKEVAQ